MRQFLTEIKNLIRDNDEFWFAPQAVAPLAVARIGLGASMFFAYLLYTPFIDRLFGADGLGSYLLGSDFIIRGDAWFY